MQVMGVVNVTDDSFSDGGRYLDPTRAVEHALALVADGADIIDIDPCMYVHGLQRLLELRSSLFYQGFLWMTDPAIQLLVASIGRDVRGKDCSNTFHFDLSNRITRIQIQCSSQHPRKIFWCTCLHYTELDPNIFLGCFQVY